MDDFHCSFLEGQDNMQSNENGQAGLPFKSAWLFVFRSSLARTKSKIPPRLNAFVIQVLDRKLVYFGEGCL